MRFGALGMGALVGTDYQSGAASTPQRDPVPDASPQVDSVGSRVLLAFLSRPGDNYFYGGRIDLVLGNRKRLAEMISDRIACDVYEILAADPYPDSYDETVARNVREQDANDRPEIANPLQSIERYDIIIIGSPIWNMRPPKIMETFAENLDFNGKTVLPLVTYAVSGMGRTERVYQEACRGATLGEGLAVLGEEVDKSGPELESWLQRVGLS